MLRRWDALTVAEHGYLFQPQVKTHSEGFARNPALQRLVCAVAIVADDTPAFRAEQELLSTERVQFFIDGQRAERWLAAEPRDLPNTSP